MPKRPVTRETPAALRDYADWLSLGDSRSLSALVERYRAAKLKGENPPTCRITTLSDWSRAFGWQDRLTKLEREATYEAEKEENRRLKEARKKLIQDEMELSTRLMERARAMLRFPLETVTKTENDGKTFTTIEAAGWRMRDAARLVEAGSRIGRLATELHTDAVKHSGRVAISEVVAEIPEDVVRERLAQRGHSGGALATIAEIDPDIEDDEESGDDEGGE